MKNENIHEVQINADGEFVQRDYHYMWIDTGAFPGDVFALPSI